MFFPKALKSVLGEKSVCEWGSKLWRYHLFLPPVEQTVPSVEWFITGSWTKGLILGIWWLSSRNKAEGNLGSCVEGSVWTHGVVLKSLHFAHEHFFPQMRCPCVFLMTESHKSLISSFCVKDPCPCGTRSGSVKNTSMSRLCGGSSPRLYYDTKELWYTKADGGCLLVWEGLIWVSTLGGFPYAQPKEHCVQPNMLHGSVAVQTLLLTSLCVS